MFIVHSSNVTVYYHIIMTLFIFYQQNTKKKKNIDINKNKKSNQIKNTGKKTEVEKM